MNSALGILEKSVRVILAGEFEFHY